ncbi:hypothetical protein QWY75_07745 [Pontixanthobacter aestiaquae]|uniref:Uncharacterized protein n=1 Tax=Pontixanthobacter aestiaquae TaxID=1509367 RepID=A0A844Z2I1_9SPHN|nr:hypothetical protein [Pontixanthobacter aestiaquae]MDN3646097.1 hypothetical protein [Pontixanthobacter aestiaquae]MXO82911.1 hypothetical protein [Pontixanthobacter aestiaquae]
MSATNPKRSTFNGILEGLGGGLTAVATLGVWNAAFDWSSGILAGLVILFVSALFFYGRRKWYVRRWLIGAVLFGAAIALLAVFPFHRLVDVGSMKFAFWFVGALLALNAIYGTLVGLRLVHRKAGDL